MWFYIVMLDFISFFRRALGRKNYSSVFFSIVMSIVTYIPGLNLCKFKVGDVHQHLIWKYSYTSRFIEKSFLPLKVRVVVTDMNVEFIHSQYWFYINLL